MYVVVARFAIAMVIAMVVRQNQNEGERQKSLMQECLMGSMFEGSSEGGRSSVPNR